MLNLPAVPDRCQQKTRFELHTGRLVCSEESNFDVHFDVHFDVTFEGTGRGSLAYAQDTTVPEMSTDDHEIADRDKRNFNHFAQTHRTVECGSQDSYQTDRGENQNSLVAMLAKSRKNCKSAKENHPTRKENVSEIVISKT